MDKFYIIPDSGNGAVIDISDNIYYAIGKGMRGHDMPFHTQQEIKLPIEPGSAHVTTQIGTRRVFVPLIIGGSTPAEYREKKNDLVLGMYNQEFVLRFERGALPIRDLYCRYQGGLEGTGQRGQTWLETVLSLRSSDPFFYGTTQGVQKDFTVGTVQLSLPWPPVKVSQSQIAEAIQEINIGEVLSWPIWELHGPFTYAKMTHIDEGKDFEITVSVADGEIIDIDTRTFFKTVIDRTSGDSFWEYVEPGGEMFPILPGVNNMSVTMTGATANSKVVLTYIPRFLRA